MQSTVTPGLCSGEFLPLSLPSRPQGAFTGPTYWLKEWFCPPMPCPGPGRWQVHFKPLPKPQGRSQQPRSQRRSRGSSSHCPMVLPPRRCLAQGVLGTPEELSWDQFLCREGAAAGRAVVSSCQGFLYFTQASLRSSTCSQAATEHGFKTVKIFLLIGFHFKTWKVLYNRAQIFLSNLIPVNAPP